MAFFQGPIQAKLPHKQFDGFDMRHPFNISHGYRKMPAPAERLGLFLNAQDDFEAHLNVTNMAWIVADAHFGEFDPAPHLEIIDAVSLGVFANSCDFR
jgi:hypothetical protein